MIFFKNKVDVSKVFLIEDNDTKAIERINEIGEWVNPPDPITYSDKISLYAYLYAYEKGLRDYDLTGFTSTISGLLTDMAASFGFPRKIDMEIEDKAIMFINAFEATIPVDAEPTDVDKAKASGVVRFLLSMYLEQKENELIKKSVVLTKRQIELIEQIEGNKFSDKLRTVVDLFFHEKE